MTNLDKWLENIAEIFTRHTEECKNLYLKVNDKGCFGLYCERCHFYDKDSFIEWLKMEVDE